MNALVKAMVKRNINPDELSEKSGIAKCTVIKYMREPLGALNSHWSTKKKLADALGITVHDLIMGE